MPKKTFHSVSLRQSNIELLRLFAMFLVLVVHANFFSLGAPTREESINEVWPTFTRFFFQNVSVGCVDIFVLISGWFGIRPKLKGFLNFVFQCLFFLCGIYVVYLIAGYADFSLTGVLECFVLTKHNWFIKSYILLYILAPVLNAFVEHASEKELRTILISFYSFQMIFGWASSSVTFFSGGYSTMSFFGLYLLARYVKLYANRWTSMPKRKDMIVFLTIVVLQTAVAYLMCRFDTSNNIYPYVRVRMFLYNNPLVVISSLYILLYFTKLKLPNIPYVNKIATSSFAVFLLHQQANFIPFFKNTVTSIYDSYHGVGCLFFILLFLLALFVIAVLIDQIRIFFWKIIEKNIVNNYEAQ